jgi:hypothetical protein
MYLECFFSNYEREGKMPQTQKYTVLPPIVISSETFQAGYEQADMGGPVVGWPIEHAPTESTLIQFLRDASGLIVEHEYNEGTLRLLAGLLAGWLRRI